MDSLPLQSPASSDSFSSQMFVIVIHMKVQSTHEKANMTCKPLQPSNHRV